ncbi:hypothetical protein BXZ70DRAFT_911734, partial [Cristinia sonorae]
MPFSFSKTSIIHPTHATTSAQSLGVRPDLNRLYTGRDYWENKGHHDFSLWKVLSRKNSSSIRVEPEYNKKADGWKVSSVTGGKAGKPFGCLVPNSQVGILRLFIFRYHIARTIALNPLWKEFDENVQFAAKLEAEFYYAVMMAVKEEMRGAKKQKRNVPMHDVRLGALDEWMAFELFTKGDYFEYLQHPEIAVGAKGAVIEDLHEQLKGYITQKAKSIADENYLDSTRWTDPKQREMWYTALHDGGWSISRCKESNGWAGWTELPPLQQGTMDFGPFPSLEVEEWISSVEVPMKPDDGECEESAGEMCEEEGGAVKEGTATQRSVREGDDNLDDEGESMIVKAGYESYSDEIERRGIVNSDDDLFQHFTDPLREPVPEELLPTCISPQLLMLSHGGQQAGFMAQNIALSTGIANGEVPAARNEDIPPSGIPPAADSPGAPQPPAVLLPEHHGEVPAARNEDIPPSGIPPAADSPGAPQPPAVLLPEHHGEVPAARNEDIPPSGIPPAADSPGAPQPPAVLLPEHHGEVPVARNDSWALPEMGVNVTDLGVPFTPEDGKDSSTTQQSKALTKSAKAARRSTRKTSKSEYSSLRAAVSNAQDKPTDDSTEQDVAVRGGDEFVEGDDIVHDCSESWALPEMGVNVTDLEVPFTPEDGKDSSTTQQSKVLTKSAGKTKTFPRASRSGTDGWVESGQSEQTPPSMETLTPQSQSGLHPELITAEQVHSWDAVWRRNQEEQSEWTEESEEELEVERIMSSPPPTEPDPDTTELESGVLSIQTAYDDWFTKWKGRL